MKQGFKTILTLFYAAIFLVSCGSHNGDALHVDGDTEADVADSTESSTDGDTDSDVVDNSEAAEASDASDLSDLPDCDSSSDRQDYGLTWVPIPGGSFMMGCVPQDSDCWDDEKPRHKVTLSTFEMTATQMTRKQECALPGASCDTNTTECEDCPVERVEGGQAEYVCETAGGHLPTEAQWEYVARAGTETIFACGDDRSCTDNNISLLHSPVGQKSPNTFGIYDIISDYLEYCQDMWYNYTLAEETNPLHKPYGSIWNVLRKGAWSNSARVSDTGASVQGDGITFRCVRKAACK